MSELKEDMIVRLADKCDILCLTNILNQHGGANCVLEDVRICLSMSQNCRIFLAELKNELLGCAIIYKRDQNTFILRHVCVQDSIQSTNHTTAQDYVTKPKVLSLLLEEIAKYLSSQTHYIALNSVEPDNRVSDLDTLNCRLLFDSQSASIVKTHLSGGFSKPELPFPSPNPNSLSFDVWSGKPSIQDIKLPSNPQRYHICHAQISRLQILVDFDSSITKLKRTIWLQKMRDHSNSMIPGSVALWLTYQMDPNLSGYGFIRPGANGIANLGPLYATSPSTARMLFRALIGSFRPARENGVRVVVPSDNQCMRELCKESGLKYDKHQEMFGETNNSIEWSNIYCISNSISEIV